MLFQGTYFDLRVHKFALSIEKAGITTAQGLSVHEAVTRTFELATMRPDTTQKKSKIFELNRIMLYE